MPVTMTIREHLDIVGLSNTATMLLKSAANFENPAFAKKQHLGLWVGQTPKVLTLWSTQNEHFILPRGMVPQVIDVCNRCNLVLHTHDETVYPALSMPMTPGRLHDYQRHALNRLLEQRTGFLSAPTGSGKTNILLSAIARLQTPTIVLTHTTGLLNQTAQRCRDWLHVEPGLIGAGHWDIKPITIAMIQTLTRRPEAKELRDVFGCVMVDEAAHAACETWTAATNLFRARHKYGVTATPWRKDKLEQMMWLTLGPVVSTISQAEVVDHGSVIKPTFSILNSSFTFDLQDSKDWTKMITALIEDGARNELLIETIEGIDPSKKVLVLTDRIDHAVHLGERLLDMGIVPVVMTGDLKKREIAAAFERIRNGAPLTIATAALMGEGIDVPGWDVLVLASPFAGGPRTLQAVGRVCRAAAGKSEALVIDLCDPLVPALVRARYARQAALRKGGVV